MRSIVFKKDAYGTWSFIKTDQNDCDIIIEFWQDADGDWQGTVAREDYIDYAESENDPPDLEKTYLYYSGFRATSAQEAVNFAKQCLCRQSNYRDEPDLFKLGQARWRFPRP